MESLIELIEEGLEAYNRDDYATALKLLRPLAAGGRPEVQFVLGSMYRFGHGVPQDCAEAVRWLWGAAARGHAAARIALLDLFRRGHGAPEQHAELADMFRDEAERGDSQAQGQLGHMYESGIGVPPDTIHAHKWFTLAGMHLSGFHHARDQIALKMTPHQIVEAQRLAREWKPK